MHIVFVVEGYATPQDPIQPFVRNLIEKICEKGVECSVIAPQSLSRAIKHRVPVRRKHWVDTVENGNHIDVYQPIYITFSNRLLTFNNVLQIAAAKRAYKRIKKPIDSLYAHFWHMGVVASKINTSRLPLFIASGEDHITVRERYSGDEIQELQRQLTGIIYVSSQTRVDATTQSLGDNIPNIVAPNGYDPKMFRPLDKSECRKKLRFPQDVFIVSFVGSFDDRKGALRVKKAIENATGRTIHSCYIGKGGQDPRDENTLFCGTVSHDEIPFYLCASDVFILPTRSEGCCNAIVEALGCQLPVISSKGQFNDDILDDTCSLRVNPDSIEEITRALVTLRDDCELRQKLICGAASKAEKLSIETRSEHIIEFINARVKN